MKDTLVDK